MGPEAGSLVFVSGNPGFTGRHDTVPQKDNRSMAVAAPAIIEALRHLYDAGPLANELEGRTSVTGVHTMN